MKFTGRTRLLTLGLAGVLSLGAIGAVAADQASDGGVRSTFAAALGRDGGRHHLAARLGFRELMRASGLEAQVFLDGGAQGQTIEQILVANGLDAATVQARMLADLQAKLDELAGDGRIDQPKADEIYARAEEKLPEFMQVVPHRPEGGPDGGHPFLERFARGLIESAAGTIGITPQELVSELRQGDGTTIADVASANGIDPQDVIDDAIAAANARIDEAVNSGNLSTEQGETAKARAAEAIARAVNEGRPHRGDAAR